MKKSALVLLLLLLAFMWQDAAAQCAMCTKTAQQLGEGPAKGMNSGILYLMFMPFAIMGYIVYRWWKSRDAA